MRTSRLPQGLTRRAFGMAATAAMISLAPLAQAQEVKKGGTLTVAIETDVRGFDTVKGGVYGQTGETVARSMMEPLLNWNSETNEPMPLLATEWSVSEDNLVWTLKLREGVKFHDGTDFDSEDVAAHYNRILDPEQKSASRSFIASIKEVVPVDPLTVEFHLEHPWLALLPYLSTTSMSGPIPPSEHVAADRQNREPVGTGPFRFVEWASGDRIVVERWDGYRDADEINLDRIVYRVLPDTQTRYASLQSGEVDVIWSDRGQTIIEAQENKNIVTLSVEGAGAATNLMNAKREPLSNATLRKAMAHLWNQDAANKITWKGTRPFVTHPLGSVKDCGEANYRHFDVEKAKEFIAQYLQETGQEKVPDIIMIHTTTPRGRELGTIYQQTAKAAGVNVVLEPVDQSTLVARTFKGDFDITGWRIADGADMGPQLYAYAKIGSSYNLTGFNNPELDKLADEMRVATDRDEYLELQCRMVEMMNDDGSIEYVGGGKYYAFTTPRVKGVPAPYRGVVDVTRAWIDG